ncbi:unnamed protein product [Calypogeia fissa]
MAMKALLRWLSPLLLLAFVLSLIASAPFSAASDDLAEEFEEAGAADGGEVGLVGEELDDFFSGDVLGSAPGVDTVFYFPKNPDKLIVAGDKSDILVGVSNFGESPLKVTSIRASINLPYDHRIFVQNFTAQEFVNSTVPPGIQASFPYSFTISKYLQPGGFSLVASIYYDIDNQAHRTTFYNGTVEVVEAHGFFSGETLFLITLGLGLSGLLGIWAYGQIQRLSKKARRTKKVETGTRGPDAANNEWLQGTAFTAKRSNSITQSTKSKKKK